MIISLVACRPAVVLALKFKHRFKGSKLLRHISTTILVSNMNTERILEKKTGIMRGITATPIKESSNIHICTKACISRSECASKNGDTAVN